MRFGDLATVISSDRGIAWVQPIPSLIGSFSGTGIPVKVLDNGEVDKTAISHHAW